MPTDDLLTNYLRLAKRGLKLKEIAMRLGIKEGQLKYKLIALRKLGVPVPNHVSLKKQKARQLNDIIRKENG